MLESQLVLGWLGSLTYSHDVNLGLFPAGWLYLYSFQYVSPSDVRQRKLACELKTLWRLLLPYGTAI